MKTILLLALTALLISSCSNAPELSQDDQVNTAVAILATQSAASSPALATGTQQPAATEEPTAEPPSEPIVFDGTGTGVVGINKQDGPMILKIVGNAGARYFGVTSYDAGGNIVNLLVNTTDAYEGLVPIDIDGSTLTTRLQIEAEGDWHLELMPLQSAREISVPGSISGKGDEVILISGTPDLIHITGNSSGRYFGVIGYGAFIPDLLVNTTEPYDGNMVIGHDTSLLVITATGDWTVEITDP